MEEREDNSYLKQYVKSHPDNQMAWYLLGKDYMLQGKEAKANYCFLQAGDVYEAYEKKEHSLGNRTPEQAIRSWNRKRRFRSLGARTAAACALLLCLSVAAPAAPWDGKLLSEQPAPARLGLQQPGGVGVVFVREAGASPLGQALGALVYGRSDSGYGIAVQLGSEGAWYRWTGGQRALLTVERPGGAGTAKVSLLDTATCRCTPEDATAAYAALAGWSAQREQQWVLQSAIQRYRERTKAWPASLAQLVQPYPNNTLSGDTPEMAAMFPEALRRVKSAAGVAAEAAPSAAGASGAAAGGSGGDAVQGVPDDPGVLKNGGLNDGLPDDALEIVVDKKAHRLALVSGNVVVRSYAVGLGGTRTPDGTFVISEKVRNPNGRDDGDFGSRGMALSDTLYAIHGTNEPDSIGKDESLGCVRMLKADVEELFDLAPLGTKVTITNGVLPASASEPPARFKLAPKRNETNPAKVYHWLN